jgi:hypothetical protein
MGVPVQPLRLKVAYRARRNERVADGCDELGSVARAGEPQAEQGSARTAPTEVARASDLQAEQRRRQRLSVCEGSGPDQILDGRRREVFDVATGNLGPRV